MKKTIITLLLLVAMMTAGVQTALAQSDSRDYERGWYAGLSGGTSFGQATRIVSTDKKAQKAGGLCLALKGVPMKHTDDVDVDKEYQLIPLDSI
jgi:opacity protein-like surface antigen